MLRFVPRLLLLCAAVMSASAAFADVIYLRGVGEAKATALRGSVKPGASGKLIITTDAGKTLEVEASRVVSIVKDEATLPDAEREAIRKAEEARVEAAKAAEKAAAEAEKKKADASEAGTPTSENTGDANSQNPTQPSSSDASPQEPESTSGILPLAKGAKWERTDGVDDFRDEVTDVENEGGVTIYAMKRTYLTGNGKTTFWKIQKSSEDGKTVWKIKRGMAAATTMLVEPAKVGETWKDGNGETWKVTSLTETYTDRNGKSHFNCVRIDQMNAKGSPIEGRQQIYAVGIGRINDGFKSVSLPNS